MTWTIRNKHGRFKVIYSYETFGIYKIAEDIVYNDGKTYYSSSAFGPTLEGAFDTLISQVTNG